MFVDGPQQPLPQLLHSGLCSVGDHALRQFRRLSTFVVPFVFICCLLSVVFLSAVCGLSSSVFSFLSAVFCLLSFVSYLLFLVFCLQSFVCSLLSIALCLLSFIPSLLSPVFCRLCLHLLCIYTYYLLLFLSFLFFLSFIFFLIPCSIHPLLFPPVSSATPIVSRTPITLSYTSPPNIA
jgi:hypothetical protein